MWMNGIWMLRTWRYKCVWDLSDESHTNAVHLFGTFASDIVMICLWGFLSSVNVFHIYGRPYVIWEGFVVRYGTYYHILIAYFCSHVVIIYRANLRCVWLLVMHFVHVLNVAQNIHVISSFISAKFRPFANL